MAGSYQDYGCAPCGSFQCHTSWSSWVGGIQVFSGFYNWNDFAALADMILQDYKTGNLDTDSAREAIEYYSPFGWGIWFPFDLRVRDLLNNSIMWSRSLSGGYPDHDVQGLRFISTVDINRDNTDELLAYKVQGSQPVLYEFQVSDGTTLGFTQLPFRADTMVIGLFGQPAKPKLLLSRGDSLVVFGIDAPCALAKGDFNGDENLTIFDVTLQLNCVFLNEGSCDLCLTDVNCDGVLSAADVVLELLAVFLGRPFPCS